MEPREQASNDTMPSWSGPRLQRTLPLKSHPKATSRRAARQADRARRAAWGLASTPLLTARLQPPDW